MKNKNKANYKNLKYIPTKKLNEILNSHHTTGIDGRDYGPVKEELEEVLWARETRIFESNMKQFKKDQNEYQDYLESLESLEA